MASQPTAEATGASAPAPQTHQHQVVIVGGGITGLTMALMLQKLGVDYILLEAYGSVTPEQGASIGLHANGLRILDQLGVYDEVSKRAVVTQRAITRDAIKGKRIMTREATPLLKARHGYGGVFMARHDLLCVLHEAIKEKDRLLVNRRVTKVESLPDSARVYTEDGAVIETQVVVGADGVRSFVRKEMWRHAEEEEKKQRPEQEPSATKEKGRKKSTSSSRSSSSSSSSSRSIPASDKADIPVEHACIFGTAKGKPGFGPGDVLAACGTRSTAGLMSAPNGDLFFFWFWTLPAPQNTCPITDIPRFTEEDKQRELERCKDIVVTDEGLTMGEVLAPDNVRFSGVTALPHFVLDRWSSGRMVIIGDAAHKFNPLVGQGGNSCIESCAALVNALQEHVLPAASVTQPWPLETLTKAFVAVERDRVPRVRDMVEKSQDAMRRAAWESWKPKVMSRYIVPLIPLAKLTDFYSWFITPGLRLYGDKFGAPPQHEHSMPWEDEKAGYRAPAIAAA